jgi:hypothetical protein
MADNAWPPPGDLRESSAALERPQEIDEVLLLLHAQPIEMLDYSICLAAAALVSSDGFAQIGRPPIMQEEDSLSDAPQRRGSELVGAGATLRDTVGEPCSHVVNEQVRKKIRRLVGKRGARAGGGTARNLWTRGKRWCMAVNTAYLCERDAAFLAGGRRSSGSRRRQHAHEVGERFNVGENGRVGTAGGSGRREVERVLRSGVKNATRRFVALLLEELVRHSHLDVVGLTRKDQQRFVLRLPPKTRHRSVIRTAVHVSA